MDPEQADLDIRLKQLFAAIRRAIQRDQPRSVETLVRELDALMKPIAAAVPQGATPQQRSEFANEATSFLVIPRKKSPARICRYEATGSALAWLRKTLNRIWINQQRRIKVASPDFDVDALEVSVEPLLEGGLLEMLSEPFTAADLDEINAWSWREQLEILALSRCYERMVLVDGWEPIVLTYEQRMSDVTDKRVNLDRPFPAIHVDDSDDRNILARFIAERIQREGISLEKEKATLNRRYLRGARARLARLPSMKAIFEVLLE